MFDFYNSLYALNSSIYRDLIVVNLSRKKEQIQKEIKDNNKNLWKIKEVACKSCQTSPRKYHNKGCQTDVYIPKTLSEAIYNHMQTQTIPYSKNVMYYETDTSSTHSSSEISVDIEEPIEFIMLDS